MLKREEGAMNGKSGGNDAKEDDQQSLPSPTHETNIWKNTFPKLKII